MIFNYHFGNRDELDIIKDVTVNCLCVCTTLVHQAVSLSQPRD